METQQTVEFIDWIGDLAAESIRSFADGAQGTDLINFSDELIKAPTGLGGYFQNAKKEAAVISVEELSAVWDRQQAKIIEAGAAPFAAATIVSGLQTVYYGFAWSVRSSQDEKEVEIAA